MLGSILIGTCCGVSFLCVCITSSSSGLFWDKPEIQMQITLFAENN